MSSPTQKKQIVKISNTPKTIQPVVEIRLRMSGTSVELQFGQANLRRRERPRESS
jgi:hypothetical protein